MQLKRKITLGFSSCPNDTFIFNALIHGAIDTEGLDFELVVADVEELNRRAFGNDLDVTKISFNAFTRLANDYILLDSGAALGENCGPLIIAREQFKIDEISTKIIAIPGVNTTANLLLTWGFPNIIHKEEMIFSAIEEAVLNGKVDAGLIIHESRFTYEQKGLKKIIDMGELWETRTKTPTPLGGIIANRRLNEETIRKINRVLRRSVEHAFANPKFNLDFIRCHAQEMSEEVMFKHIGLYVNHYSITLGKDGRNAVLRLFKTALQLGLIEKIPMNLFVEY